MKTLILSAIKWFAGFFQDVKKEASSKRAITYVATYLMGAIVFAAIEAKWANDAIHAQIWWGVVVIVLFGIGAIAKEQISKIIDHKFGDKNETPN